MTKNEKKKSVNVGHSRYTKVFAVLLVLASVAVSGWAQSTDLTPEEISSLRYMREEEKLAHDVYVALYESWNLPVFANIAASETRHTEQVQALLSQFGIADAAAGRAPGSFENPELQTLYDSLVAQGTTSRQDAIEVGILIEETDIADLEADLEILAHPDIKRAYDFLLRGSRQHLAAFSRQNR